MLVHRRVTSSSKFAGTHLYTWVERGTMRVKYLAQEHNAVPRPGLEPGPPDAESSALTIRPPRLPLTHKLLFFNWFELGYNLTSTPCSCRSVSKALVLQRHHCWCNAKSQLENRNWRSTRNKFLINHFNDFVLLSVIKLACPPRCINVNDEL